MSRRNRARTPTPKAASYADAFPKLDALEQAVMQSMVTVPWTIDDAVNWLWDEDIVRRLKASHGIARSNSYIQRWSEQIRVQIGNAVVHVQAAMDMDAAKMTCPIEWLVAFSPAKNDLILPTMLEVHAVWQKFQEVRKVVEWLSAHATPGAAKYYFPALGALLHPEHPVNTCSTERYREPTENVAPIIPAMRRAAITVAGALMCPEIKDTDPKREAFAVSFVIDRDEGKYSQQFRLL